MLLGKNKLIFTKMHGLGNDFIVIDSTKNKFFFSTILVKKWSNRFFGIGFDQLLIIEKSICQKVDFNYRIINSNGIEVEQCGNGARCIAYYLSLKKKIFKKKICIKTKNRFLNLEILKKNLIKVNMGKPLFSITDIPFLYKKCQQIYSIKLSIGLVHFFVVSMGNPHCVIQVSNLDIYPVKKIGKELSNHPLFPNGVNVNFMQIMSSDKIKLRVYERDVGETLSCGSGACASVSIGILHNFLHHDVMVSLPGGQLYISWKGMGKNLYMVGEAAYVYDGVLYY